MLTAAMVRMSKGATASILLLLITEKSGGNQEWIERYTGYTDKPVSQALAFLLELGLITKAGERGDYVYQLAIGAEQLPLPVEKIEDLTTEGIEEEEKRLNAKNAEIAKEEKREKGEEGEGVKNFKKNESESFRLEDSGGGGFNQNLDSGVLTPPPESGGVESEKFRLELLLERHGVRNPAKDRILRGEYELDFVQAHLAQAENMGRAIYRIQHNWPVDQAKWRDWLSLYCPDCENYRSGCTCDPLPGEDEGEEDEPIDDG